MAHTQQQWCEQAEATLKARCLVNFEDIGIPADEFYERFGDATPDDAVTEFASKYDLDLFD